MIDIVFLLLIFFMCATRFRIPEGELSSFLPRDRGVASTFSSELVYPCVISLERADGRIRCLADARELGPGAPEAFETYTGIVGPDLEELESYLAERRLTSLQPLSVHIDADPDVPAKYVVGVLNRCTKLQIQDVALVAPALPLD